METKDYKLKIFKLHPRLILASVPDNITSYDDPLLKDIFRDTYNREYEYYKRYPGYNEALYIEDQIYKLTEFPLQLHPPRIQVKVNWYLKFLVEQKKVNTRSQRKEPTFKDLFFNPSDADKVDKILEDNEYTKGGKWIDQGAKKRIALPFYVLKDPYPEINLIRPGNDTSQLKLWCVHYGLNVQYKGGDVTLKNLRTRPAYLVTEKPDYIEFVELFKGLKK